MRLFLCGLILTAGAVAPAFAAGPLADTMDEQLKSAERDAVSLVEAMPADKFNFAPTNGEFKGVRSFATQAKHIATINYQVASAMLGQKPPVDTGKTDNGPDTLKTKAEIVTYLKGAMALSHKAIQTLTDKNSLEPVRVFDGPMTRIAAASLLTWHTFDHYGQMVVYARMNAVVPPASQPAPPPAAKKDDKKK